MNQRLKTIILFFLLILSSNAFSQKEEISKEIFDESCDCIKKIDNNLDKQAKNDSIKACITSSIISEQAKKMLVEMSKTVDTLLAAKKDTVIGNGRRYEITTDKNFDEIQNKLMADCPYLKTLVASNNEKHKNSVSDKKKALEYYQEGDKYFSKEDYTMALVEYNKAVKNDPKFAFAWDNLGICYRKLNRYKEAINCYQKSFEIDPKGKTPLMNMAVAYSLLNDNKSAIETYKKFLTLHPDDPEGFYGIARIQNFTKDYENALENAFKAYEIYTNTSSPYAQDAINVMKDVVANLKEENKIQIFNDFAEKHGIEKIKQ